MKNPYFLTQHCKKNSLTNNAHLKYDPTLVDIVILQMCIYIKTISDSKISK